MASNCGNPQTYIRIEPMLSAAPSHQKRVEDTRHIAIPKSYKKMNRHRWYHIFLVASPFSLLLNFVVSNSFYPINTNTTTTAMTTMMRTTTTTTNNGTLIVGGGQRFLMGMTFGNIANITTLPLLSSSGPELAIGFLAKNL